MLQLRIALASNSDGAREKAVKTLGASRNPAAVEPCMRMMRDPSPMVRRTAAIALGQLGDAKATDVLIAHLHDDKPGMRRAIATALGQLGNPKAVPPLITLLKEKDPDLRPAVVAALVKIGVPAVQPLVGLLHEKDEYVRQAAIRALGEINQPAAIAPLASLLNESGSDVHFIATALEQMHWKPTNMAERVRFAFAREKFDEPVSYGADAVEPLSSVLHDHNPALRKAAATALGKIRSPQGVQPLIQAAKDNASEVREAAASALGMIGDPSGVPALLHILDEDSSEVQEAAAWAAGEIGDPDAVPPLIKLALQGEHRVRAAAISALGRFPQDPRTTEPLMISLRDKRYDVRKAGMDALARLGSAILPSLEAALEDMEPHVRRAAAGVMRLINDPESAWSLMRTLRDQDPGVRKEVVIALAHLKAPQAVDGIVARINDEDPEVQLAAISALGEIGNARAIGPLCESIGVVGVQSAVLQAILAVLQADAGNVADGDLQMLASLSAPDEDTSLAAITEAVQKELQLRKAQV